MRIIEKIQDMKAFIKEEKKQGKTVGFVPTMGNLHDAHLSLLQRAKKECNIAVTSIFVNPIQFGKDEDFSKYPRTFMEDQSKLKEINTDVLFYPGIADMYFKSKSQTFLDDEVLSKGLCGKFRPGHFSGVLTVVMKLFNIVQPDKAYFGMKDYQQYIIVKNMVESLNMDIEIIGCPLVREADGLAMSSRNSYLSEKDRQNSLILYKTLKIIEESFNKGESNPLKLKNLGLNELTKVVDVQYLEIVDSNTLEPVTKVEKGNLVAIAAYCGTTRLIDNLII